jgi:UPF0755 protein
MSEPENEGAPQRRLSRRRIRTLAALVALAIAGVAVYGIFNDPNNFTNEPQKIFFVSRGETFASVVDSLEAHGIIRSRALFVFVGKVMGGTTRIQTGKYIFGTGISNLDLWNSLRGAINTELIPVTIPEGLRARGHARVLAETIGIDSAEFMRLVYDESFTHSLGITSHSLEGYLMPDTYHFYWQPPEKEVIIRMVEQFNMFYDDSLRARAKDLAWTTNQVMTLASIVEGEAVLKSEMRRISGVYHNRLRKGMRLQADPTIQYMIEDGPRRVLYADLLIDNPYNTYRRPGLPPGPVNNPGRGAILASLFPEKHRFIFFVANGRGGHWFTTNYGDHMRHVRQYRRQQRAVRRLQPMSATRGTAGGSNAQQE